MSYYCSTCDRTFWSWSAIEQHKRDSNKHHICPTCDDDLPSAADLSSYRREEHLWCSRCCYDLKDELGYYGSLWTHEIEEHHRCDECGDFFQSESNLRNHKRTHSARDVECYGEPSGCRRQFDCVSAMMLHLEGGNCPSGMDLDEVDTLAFRCYQKRKYTTSKADSKKYRCPTCELVFSKLSGLLQHAESKACDEDEDEWPLCKLLHYIEMHT